MYTMKVCTSFLKFSNSPLIFFACELMKLKYEFSLLLLTVAGDAICYNSTTCVFILSPCSIPNPITRVRGVGPINQF